MVFSLQGKTILLTGAAGILGFNYAKTLTAQGAKLILLDRNVEKLHAEATLKDALIYQTDITKEENWKKLKSELAAKKTHVDVLINNAAGKSDNFFDAFEDYKLDDWHEVMNINLTAVMMGCQNFGVQMAAKGAGSIINISSIYGVVAPNQDIYEGSEYNGRPINTPAVYSASKAAIIGLTRYLATYWGKQNVRVNCITPGGVFSGQNDVFVKNYSSRVPLGRMGKPDELGGALVFLASDESTYVTGQNIIVDGGWTAW